MRHPPRFTYCGLTIVMSNPSRHDLKERQLLSAWAGKWFNRDCLGPSFNRFQCDIRTLDTLKDGFIADTKAVLLLGEDCLYAIDKYTSYGIGEQRGCPLEVPWKIPTIVSYLPQDCIDPQNYEVRLNPSLMGKAYVNKEFGDDDTNKGRKGKTSRENFKFWLARDTEKISSILPKYRGELCCPVPNKSMDDLFSDRGISSDNIYPTAQTIVDVLLKYKNDSLYLDIETDVNYNIRCFAFCFESSPIFVVPIFRYDYSLAYSDIPHILWALAIAMRDNEVVCHNTMFDLFILAWKYKIPTGRKIYDTMLAHSRCFPNTEKSLGHCTSLWTWEPYHKDEGIFDPKCISQEESLWRYNGKDVLVMREIRRSIDAYAKRNLINESIRQVNASIRPYLINSLYGIRFDDKKRQEVIEENDKLLTQYMRIIKILTGGVEVLPTSSKSCVEYFHTMLNYPVVKRSKITKAPSLDEISIDKLKLKHPDNPVLDLVLAYRSRAKENGILSFEPWTK